MFGVKGKELLDLLFCGFHLILGFQQIGNFAGCFVAVRARLELIGNYQTSFVTVTPPPHNTDTKKIPGCLGNKLCPRKQERVDVRTKGKIEYTFEI